MRVCEQVELDGAAVVELLHGLGELPVGEAGRRALVALIRLGELPGGDDGEPDGGAVGV